MHTKPFFLNGLQVAAGLFRRARIMQKKQYLPMVPLRGCGWQYTACADAIQCVRVA
jgi:hypothetical protein